MTKRITGINDLQDALKKIKDEKNIEIPRNRIVLVDYTWDLENDVMPDMGYLTPECRSLVEHRMKSRLHPETEEELNLYLVPDTFKECRVKTGKPPESCETNPSLHGTACTAVLKLSKELAECLKKKDDECSDDESEDKEADLWNICPDTDVFIAPVREFANICPERFNATFKLFLDRQDQDEKDLTVAKLLKDRLPNVGEFWCEVIDEVLATAPKDQDECINCAKAMLSKTIRNSSDKEGIKVLSHEIAALLWRLSKLLFAEYGIAATLKEIEKAAEGGKLERGDVVVMPIEFRPDDGDPVAPTVPKCLFDDVPKEILSLPVIIYPQVEAAIKRLTAMHGISVVIAAGNARKNLSQLDLGTSFENAMCGTIAVGREDLFKSHGVSCGAVIVGATDLENEEEWLGPVGCGTPNDPEDAKKKEERRKNCEANHGICVDAFGRGAATTVVGSKYEKETEISKDLYAHWRGSSIAAVVVAASLATLQHYLMAVAELGYTAGGGEVHPLEPIEAREYIRTYRAKNCADVPCTTELMGPPPNVMDILDGINLSPPKT